MRLLAPLLAVALLAAGCITSTSEPLAAETDAAPAPEAPAPAETTETEEAEETDDAPASASSPPASGGEAPAANASQPETTTPPPPREEQVTGSAWIPATASPPCHPPAPCEAGAPREPVKLDLPQVRPTRAVLGAQWTPVVAAFKEMVLNVTTPEGVLVGQASGASPLVIEVDLALLGDATQVVVGLAPGAPGVAAQQRVDLVLDLRYG